MNGTSPLCEKVGAETDGNPHNGATPSTTEEAFQPERPCLATSWTAGKGHPVRSSPSPSPQICVCGCVCPLVDRSAFWLPPAFATSVSIWVFPLSEKDHSEKWRPGRVGCDSMWNPRDPVSAAISKCSSTCDSCCPSLFGAAALSCNCKTLAAVWRHGRVR